MYSQKFDELAEKAFKNGNQFKERDQQTIALQSFILSRDLHLKTIKCKI